MERTATLLLLLPTALIALEQAAKAQEMVAPGGLGCTTFYRDADQDGWGVYGDSFCISQPTYPYTAVQFGDCDDNNAAVRPGMIEVCDGIDNDCDGQVDELGAFGCTTFYRDLDQDGFGDSDQALCACAPLAPFTASVGGDCDDTLAGVHPGAIELCDGIDNDCNGVIDDGCTFQQGCFGDGGDQLGCTDCPCDNNSLSGTSSGCLHSLSNVLFGGSGARLIASGSPSLQANDLAFELEQAFPDSFAILLSGPSSAPANNSANPCAPMASGVAQSNLLNGLRCISSGGLGPVVRHGARPIDSNGAVAVNGVGPENRWNGTFGFGAGEPRHFQVIYRVSPTEHCGTRQNSSQRVSLTLQP